MFNINNLENEEIYIKDVTPRELTQILKWYNKIDDFKFATGIIEPISIDLLFQKYAEAIISRDEFFVGIHSKADQKMIGTIKGRIHNRKRGSIWINSMIIDNAYQNAGIGSSSICLLFKHLKDAICARSVFLSVIESNFRGVGFWTKHGFREFRKIEGCMRLQEEQTVLIMRRDL